jgi:hypothetical protein
MLISSEIFLALKDAGVSDPKAAAAAALLAAHERRLARIEAIHVELLRWSLLGAGLAAIALLVAAHLR